MKARYSVRVIQGNNASTQVPVTVIASDEREARRKAIALTDVHRPMVQVDNVEEIES